MIALDLPPQIEMQIVQIAKEQNISVNDYLVSMAKEIIAQKQEKQAQESLQEIDDDEFYRLTGIRPLPSPPNPQVITNDYINELREQYGI